MLEQTDALHSKLDALMDVVRPVIAHRDVLLARVAEMTGEVKEREDTIDALTNEMNQLKSERIDLTAAIQALAERFDEATAAVPAVPAAG